MNRTVEKTVRYFEEIEEKLLKASELARAMSAAVILPTYKKYFLQIVEWKRLVKTHLIGLGGLKTKKYIKI